MLVFPSPLPPLFCLVSCRCFSFGFCWCLLTRLLSLRLFFVFISCRWHLALGWVYMFLYLSMTCREFVFEPRWLIFSLVFLLYSFFRAGFVFIIFVVCLSLHVTVIGVIRLFLLHIPLRGVMLTMLVCSFPLVWPLFCDNCLIVVCGLLTLVDTTLFVAFLIVFYLK